MSHGAVAPAAPPSAPTTSAELLRKAIHLAFGVLPLAWAFDWAGRKEIATILGVGLVLAIAIEFARAKDANARRLFERHVGAMLRPHERAHTTGATWLLGTLLVVTLFFPERPAIVALWAAAVGDAAAAIAGRTLGSALRPPLGSSSGGKSLVGSLACAGVTAAGAWWLAAASAVTALGIGAITALAERPRVMIDDNVRVALAAGLAAWGLGLA